MSMRWKTAYLWAFKEGAGTRIALNKKKDGGLHSQPTLEKESEIVLGHFKQELF